MLLGTPRLARWDISRMLSNGALTSSSKHMSARRSSTVRWAMEISTTPTQEGLSPWRQMVCPGQHTALPPADLVLTVLENLLQLLHQLLSSLRTLTPPTLLS